MKDAREALKEEAGTAEAAEPVEMVKHPWLGTLFFPTSPSQYYSVTLSLVLAWNRACLLDGITCYGAVYFSGREWSFKLSIV